MDMPLLNECRVYGTLGFVLRLSKIYGVASLRFDKIPNGWRIRTSRAAGICSKSVILVMVIMSFGSLAWDYNQKQKTSLGSQRRHSEAVVIVLKVCTISTALLAEAYSGMSRIRKAVSCLAYIQKINAALSHYGHPTSFKKMEQLVAIWSLVGGHIIVCVDYAIFMNQINNQSRAYIMDALIFGFCMEFLILKLLILQIFLIHMSVLSSLQHLNNCLKKLLQQTRKEFPANELLSTVPAKVHRLGNLFCGLRDVVRELNDSHGFLMVPLVTVSLMHLVSTPYVFYSSMCMSWQYSCSFMYCAGKNLGGYYKAVSQSWWAVYHIIDLFMIIDPCHRTNHQVTHTKHLLSQLMHLSSPTNHALNSELDLFYEHLTEKDVVYSPMGMFTLNRELIATIIGSITTYLVVMIQL